MRTSTTLSLNFSGRGEKGHELGGGCGKKPCICCIWCKAPKSWELTTRSQENRWHVEEALWSRSLAARTILHLSYVMCEQAVSDLLRLKAFVLLHVSQSILFVVYVTVAARFYENDAVDADHALF